MSSLAITQSVIELESERLRLRQWKDTDLAAFAAMNADPAVMEFFPARLTREESDAMAERIRSRIAQNGWGLWAAETRADRSFIGFVGLSYVRDSLPFAPAIEVGWRLAVPYWGRGYATEGARAALRLGFERLRLAEIVSFTAVGNRRSRAVMERLGMRAAHDFEHPELAPESRLRLHCLYRLRRDEWLRGR